MEFLAEHYPNKTIALPNPTWGNHAAVAKRAGLKAEKYRYFDPKTVGLNFAAMKEDIQNLPEGSIVLLHACAHVSNNYWLCVDPNIFWGRSTTEMFVDGY
jgi:aspartate aminotransferase